MLSSAVSFGFALTVLSGQQLDSGELAAWKKVEPTIARIFSGTQMVGAAVLIDPAGFFLCHRSSTAGPGQFARLSNGETLQLNTVSVDNITQLALLKADGWKPINRTPAVVAEYRSQNLQKASVKNSTRVLIVLSDRTIKGDLTSSSLVGVMAPSMRGLTLSEIRFEDPLVQVGGGLVFSMEGRLLGVLGATLDSQANAQARDARVEYQQKGASGAVTSGVGGGGFTFGGRGATEVARSLYGPSVMTVAYSISTDILDRVIDGFRSPAHQAKHPALGIMCRDAGGTGALVDSVRAGSPAAAAGVRPGDVILSLGGTAIQNQVEYTRALLKLNVGDEVTLEIKRGAEIIALKAKVGS